MAAVTPVNSLPPWPSRAFAGHKGTYGKALIIAGSRTMAGAAVLCGRAALRSGAGLVQVACPQTAHPTVAAGNPCYTTFPLEVRTDGQYEESATTTAIELAQTADAIAIGPGLGKPPKLADFVLTVLRGRPELPAVVDADALNALSPFGGEFLGRAKPLVLTPHPGEFSRLSGMPIAAIEANRETVAAEFATRHGVVVLLKGANTIVTDGQRLFRNSTGNPGMATGGSGDVLTGVLVALLAQGFAPFEAALLGAWVHGRAGDLAALHLGQAGLIATDLPDSLPRVFRELETGHRET